MVNSTSFNTHINILSTNRAGSINSANGIPSHINHNTTVRDVVAGRMRNKVCFYLNY